MNTQTNTPPQQIETLSGKRILLSGLSPAMHWVLLVELGLALIIGVTQFIVFFSTYGLVPSLISGLLYLVGGLVAAVLVTLLLAALKRLSWQTSLVFVFSIFICMLTLTLEIYLLPLFAFSMATIYFTVMLITGRYRELSKLKKILRYFLLGVFGALTAIILFLIIWPGPTLEGRPDKAMLALPYADRLQSTVEKLDDPSALGSYGYTMLYYSAPNQKIDPYPKHETIASRTVDASELVGGWSGIRKSQLGFGPESLPLNAQVWMPEGAGPFPLTLIVHGAHDSGDRSDGGYAYLGELLASRGIITVSVDENFLNFSMLYDMFVFAGLEDENDARAFVLLEHLRQWHKWNSDVSSAFFEKVDFDNIALIGHSRGGEAVAIAAAFAELDVYPDNGIIKFDYPFRIKSVVAIAPTHSQYEPAGLELSLENVNYLVLHGSQDMDVSSFMGADMYRRTNVSSGSIKAQVWMQYANHGQFNSSWGTYDTAGLTNLIFNRKLIMPMEEQQQAAKVFVSTFLESTLHGKTKYNALLKEFAHGDEWLPPALYITDYNDSQMHLLDSFDRGYDLSASDSELVSYSAQGFDTWTQDYLPSKWQNSNRVLTLEWSSDQTTVFTTDFAGGTVSAGDKIYISLCSGNSPSVKPNISFQIRLTDKSGNYSEMSVNDFGGVVNLIGAPIAKPPISSILGKCEPVLQMICIPTECFAGLNGDITCMEWIMNTDEISDCTLYADDLHVEKSNAAAYQYY